MGAAELSAPADVAVLGGGPAGTAAAAAARDAGLVVTLYAAGPPARMRAGESLPPGTEALVAAVFGDAGFLARDHRPAHANRSAWGGPELETSDFMFNPFGAGVHVDRRAFDASLVDAARGAGVRVIPEAAPREPRARVVIDATGRSARFARARGARRRRADRLVAAMWVLESEDADPDATTTVEAVPDGWWYTSPLPRRRRIAAFLTDADLLPRHGRWPLPPPHLRDLFAAHGYRLAGAPALTDASTSHLDVVAGPGWLATGDAAVAFDPLSSQGVVTALELGREAGRTAAALVRADDGDPLGDYAERYREALLAHVGRRRAYYELEDRWPDAPFWARRVSRAARTWRFAAGPGFAFSSG